MEHSRTILFFLATLCVATNAAMYNFNATYFGLAAMIDTDNGCVKFMRYVDGDDVKKNASFYGQKMDYTTDPIELCLKYVHQVNNQLESEKKECKDMKYEEHPYCGLITCKPGDKMISMLFCPGASADLASSYFVVTINAKDYYWCNKATSSHCVTPSELKITFELKLMDDLKIEKIEGNTDLSISIVTFKTTAYKFGMGNKMFYVFNEYGESNGTVLIDGPKRGTFETGDIKTDLKMEKNYRGYLTLGMAHLFPENNVTTISAHLGIDPGHMKAKARNGGGLLIWWVVKVVLAAVLSCLVLKCGCSLTCWCSAR